VPPRHDTGALAGRPSLTPQVSGRFPAPIAGSGRRTHTPPTLIVFLARNCLVGVATGWVLLASLFYFDVARLGELLAGSENWFLTLVLAGAGFGVTFGSLAMGTAIFLLPKDD
jgi:hypothetical protein